MILHLTLTKGEYIMPFDSEGNFTRIHNWEDDRINGIEITTDHHDEEDNNFETGLNQTLLRDGRAAMSGNLNAGGFKIINVEDGTINSDVVNYKQLSNLKTTLETQIKTYLKNLHSIGDIKASVQKSNHKNWLLCNGQAISRTTYADLFSVIGTKYGSGDGTTTFNVPDYRGKFLRGLGGNSANDMHITQNEGLPNITGGPMHVNSYGSSGTSGALTFTTTGASHNDSGGTGFDMYFNAGNSNAIYGASTHVTPINQAVNYFIRAKNE